jgi:transposase
MGTPVVERMDHLGIVAGVCDEIGLVDYFDRQDTHWHARVSLGQAVKAMVLNGLGFSNRRLYLFPQFFANKPVEELLGPGITAEDVNDDCLDRALDWLVYCGGSGSAVVERALDWQRQRDRVVEIAPHHQRAGPSLDRIGWRRPRITSADRGTPGNRRQSLSLLNVPREITMPLLPSVRTYQLFVGVDIAAASLTAAWMPAGRRPQRVLTVEQTPAGLAALQARLLADGHTPADILVVMEATGSYWILPATTLCQAGFTVSVVNPAQAHSFAKALLQRAKTDAIDAQTLAVLAAVLPLEPWTPPPAIYAELQQRLAHRDTLIALRQQLRNQLHALSHLPSVVASVQHQMEVLLATIEAQITDVEREIAQVLQQEAQWARAAQLLMTIPGIGLVTAAWLLVTTLNFTVCATAEQAAAYAGLAPNPRTSGTSVRGRATIGHGGNRRLRTALYLASLSAAQHNPLIHALYHRLREAGKPHKVARCAAARKLLHLAWAVVRTGRPFDPHYAHHLAA